MKNAGYLLVAWLGQLVFVTSVLAEPVDPADSPYTQVDPDGVPLSINRPLAHTYTPSEVAAIRKEQQKQANDKDWLVRNYEKQMQAHSTSSGYGDQSANLYYQLSTNKELAKLAGIPVLEDPEKAASPGVAPRADQPNELRPELTPGTASARLAFKPLITPLSAPEAAGLHDFYSTLLNSSTTASLLPGNSSSAPPPPTTTMADTDSSDIDTPGMIAAEKDPGSTTDAQDLSLDMLPGESVEQARQHQEDATKLELTLPMDSTQLHRAQTAQLTVPAPANSAQPAPTQVNPPPKPAPIVDENAPIPVIKEQQVAPVRSPIASPFDILNR